MNSNKEKTIILISFMIASMLIGIAHHYNLDALKWIDIPTHFIGGMVVGIFLPLSLLFKKPVLIIFLIFTIGIGWEFLELFVSNIATNDFILKISEESAGDKAQDIFFGFAGLVCMYRRQESVGNKNIKY